jgi:hypothetical protein
MNDFASSSAALLPMVIAQVPTASPDQLLTVLLGSAALAVMANQGITLWRNVSGKSQKRELNQPLTVEAAKEFAEKNHDHPQYMTRRECPERHAEDERRLKQQTDEIKTSLAGISQKLSEGMEKLNTKDEERAAKLHARIDPISKLAQSTTDRLNDHFEDHRNGRMDHAG